MLNIRTPKPVYKVFPSAVSFLLTQRRHWVFMTWQLLPFRRATFANHRHRWHKKYKMGTDLRWKHFPLREKTRHLIRNNGKFTLRIPRKQTNSKSPRRQYVIGTHFINFLRYFQSYSWEISTEAIWSMLADLVKSYGLALEVNLFRAGLCSGPWFFLSSWKSIVDTLKDNNPTIIKLLR